MTTSRVTTSRVTTSHTKKYESTHFAKYSLVWFCDLEKDVERWSGSGLYRRDIDT